MRRLVVLVAVLTLIPVSSAWATELDELLQRSRDASYQAEQVVTCTTPDGTRYAVLNIAQDQGELRVGSAGLDDVEVAAGFGGWTLSVGGGVVSSVSVEGTVHEDRPVYAMEEEGSTSFLGREATVYTLVRDGTLRAELLFDDDLGAMVQATSYSADGSVYCRRAFLSLSPESPAFIRGETLETEAVELAGETDSEFPDNLAGFERLDTYQDQDGLTFAYYSDGFFSLAVFQTPSLVELRDGVDVDDEDGGYRRHYTAGLVTYSWETRDGGMALIGDPPPDLIEGVLDELPRPEDRGLLQKLWKRVFG